MKIRASRTARIIAAAALGLAAVSAGLPSATATDAGSLARHLTFDNNSSDLKPAIETRIGDTIAALPEAPGIVHLNVMTSSAFGVRKNALELSQSRVDAVVERIRTDLEGKGLTVVVETTIWNQPGYVTSDPNRLRLVFFTLTW